MQIVIASHHQHFKFGMAKPPLREGEHGRVVAAGAGVEEIAEDDQAFRARSDQ